MTERHTPEEHPYPQMIFPTVADLPPDAVPQGSGLGMRFALADRTARLVGVAYRQQPCGCKVIGTGTLQHPFDIEFCPMHAQAGSDSGTACPATVHVLQEEANALETWRRAIAPLVDVHPPLADVLEGMGISLTKIGGALRGETEPLAKPQWKIGKERWIEDQDAGGQRYLEVLNNEKGACGYLVALVPCDEDDPDAARFLQMIVAAPEVMAIAQEVQQVYLSLADAIAALSHHDADRAKLAIEILDELHQHTRGALIVAAMKAQAQRDFPLAVQWIIPTYDPDNAQRPETDYDFTRLHTLSLQNDLGLRVVMGDPQDPIAPDVCIERAADRWRVFVHGDKGDPEYIIEITEKEVTVSTDKADEPPVHRTALNH